MSPAKEQATNLLHKPYHNGYFQELDPEQVTKLLPYIRGTAESESSSEVIDGFSRLGISQKGSSINFVSWDMATAKKSRESAMDELDKKDSTLGSWFRNEHEAWGLESVLAKEAEDPPGDEGAGRGYAHQAIYQRTTTQEERSAVQALGIAVRFANFDGHADEILRFLNDQTTKRTSDAAGQSLQHVLNNLLTDRNSIKSLKSWTAVSPSVTSSLSKVEEMKHNISIVNTAVQDRLKGAPPEDE